MWQTVGVKRITALVFLLLLSLSCSSDLAKSSYEDNVSASQDAWTPNLQFVKYRDTLVDIAAPYFENLGRLDSTLVYDAWYDENNSYMVINLSGTNYHYCGFRRSDWKNLQTASSMGRWYRANIKGSFDCRIYPVPSYPN